MSLDVLTMALNGFHGGVLIVTHLACRVSSVCKTICVCEGENVTQFKAECTEYRKQMVERLHTRSKLVKL